MKKQFLLFTLVLVLLATAVVLFFLKSPGYEQPHDGKIPVVYSPNYNFQFFGLDHLHPFDEKKYEKIAAMLKEKWQLTDEDFYTPHQITPEELRLVHTEAYLSSLSPQVIANVMGLALLAKVPMSSLEERLLTPIRYQAGGTILATHLAQKHGWSVNLGGGFHHAKPEKGGGFNIYADIPIAANVLWKENQDLKVMVIDLDVHQGNGHETAFKDDPRVTILDAYNEDIFPHDEPAKTFIDYPIVMNNGETGAEFLKKFNETLPQALDAAGPNMIFFIAGTDVFEKDPLGQTELSRDDILERDLLVYTEAKNRDIPVVYLFGGGYAKESSEIIAASINQLIALYGPLNY